MILKIQSFRKDDNGVEHEEWTLLDNIESASTFFDAVADTMVVRCSFKGGNVVKFDVHDEAYLMSDSGKTIERIRAVMTEVHPGYESLHDAAIAAMET